MSLLKPFALNKLKIIACHDPEREKPIAGPLEFEAMFNPASLSRKYAVTWTQSCAVGSTTPALSYTKNPPQNLSITLVLDGTGVDQFGIERAFAKSVNDRVQAFLEVTYHYRGTNHEPPYLLLSWGGTRWFECRLASVDIKYTLFDRDGTPLRAELAVEFVGDQAAKKTELTKNASSPDVTHSRVVRSGDTLPLLTKAVYGSSDRYLEVARWNNLDDFRFLTPGQKLLFPPIQALLSVINKGA